MACMKCGRETEAGQVFCETCLEIMEYYPVKPGTAVQIPQRTEVPVRKPVKRRGPSPEEQIRGLKRTVRWLAVSLILVVLVTGVLAFPAYEHFMEKEVLPGQNYEVVVPTAPPTVPSTTPGTTAGT